MLMETVSKTLDRCERAAVLDRIATPVRTAVNAALGSSRLRDVLNGVPLGHPLHPALAQLPVGSFMSAGILDAVPGAEKPARVLIATGVVSSVPAMAAGLADWSTMHEQQQRIGVIHAGANVAGLVLYSGSLAARATGRTARGKLLAYAGLGVMSAGAYLGGHLAYRQASGANHAEDVPHLVPAGWHDLCAVDDLAADGSPQRRTLGTVPLLVVKQGERIDVLSDRCSHLSGPLHEGSLSGDGSCITCPWHGSTFRLDDGSVVRGPATAPQHAFDVRVNAGRVEVRLPGAG